MYQRPFNRGFSLRQSLIQNGVTSEDSIRWHLANAAKMLSVAPGMDITRYRPNPNYPNQTGEGSVYQG